tara:strand:- start:358 stop:576 length:219 start_codon:yes stop_codon:yes gene_type:complete
MGESMAKVFLDVKCDSFIALDTDLTVEQAESMSNEDIYEMFVTKFKQDALNTYAKRMREEGFEFDLDFYYEE